MNAETQEKLVLQLEAAQEAQKLADELYVKWRSELVIGDTVQETRDGVPRDIVAISEDSVTLRGPDGRRASYHKRNLHPWRESDRIAWEIRLNVDDIKKRLAAALESGLSLEKWCMLRRAMIDIGL